MLKKKRKGERDEGSRGRSMVENWCMWRPMDNVRDQGDEAEPCSLSRPTYLSVYPGVYVRRELE